MKKLVLISLAVVIIALALIYLYFSTVDQRDAQLISHTENIENVQQKVIVEDDQKPQVTKNASLNGKCAKGTFNISEDLISKIKIEDNYYPYSPAFSCVLSNGTYVIGGEKVLHFDGSGNLLNTFSKEGSHLGYEGEFFEISDVTNGVFVTSNREIDPCYDATVTYTFDLNTGKYTENTKGGDDAKCWEELNARGGV